MTKVIHLPSPRAGTRVCFPVQSSAHTPAPGAAPAGHSLAQSLSPVERQASIENALTMALYFVRQPGSIVANLWAATARTNRALTLLKQAGGGNAHASPANTNGRA